MLYIHDGVLLDPASPDPQVYIETRGLVTERHEILLPGRNSEPDWLRRGRNLPESPDDPGTPDRYVIPRFTEQDGNVLEIFVDLWNVSKKEQDFHLIVEIHQADYEPDVLYNVKGKISARDSDRHEGFGVFVPLVLMS